MFGDGMPVSMITGAARAMPEPRPQVMKAANVKTKLLRRGMDVSVGRLTALCGGGWSSLISLSMRGYGSRGLLRMEKRLLYFRENSGRIE